MKEIRDEGEEPLKIEVREGPEANFVTVSLAGKLNIFSYRDLAARLDALAASRQGVRVLLNLALVTFIASSGWSTFLATRSRLKRVDGELAFSSMNNDLKRVYEAMKMDELVRSYENDEAARKGLLGIG